LVTTDGEEWRKQRLLVNSGFNSRAYAAYYPIFVSLTEKTISKFGENIGKTDTECYSIFTKFTLDILGKSIFHYNFGSLEGKSDENYEAHKTLLSVVNRKIGILLSLFPWLEKFPIKDVEDIHSSVDSLKGLFQRIIDERKSGKKYGDILEHLLESAENYGLSPIELMSNIWIFFVAGHETTATALTWACVCLSSFPEVQEKVFQEIIGTIETEIPKLEDLSKLTYLDCFIQEVLRMHPPVPLLPTRIAVEEVKFGNQVIPKNSVVCVGIDVIHKNPKYWSEPENFVPERFLAENKKGRHHYAHLPFSVGPRQCIGNNFSLIEQRLFLSRLLQKYRILPPKDFPPQNHKDILSFGMNHKVYIRLEAREYH